VSVRPAQRVKNRFVGSPPFALRRDDRDAVAQSYPSLASRLHKPRAARPNKRLFQLYARPPHMSRGSVRSGCRRGPAFHPSAHPVLAAPYRTNVCSNYTPGHPTCQGAESRHLKSYGGEHHQAICDPTEREGGKWQEKGFRRRPGLTDDGMRRLGQAERTTSRRAFPVSFAVSGVRFAPVSLDFLRFSDPTVGGSNPPWRARPGATVC